MKKGLTILLLIILIMFFSIFALITKFQHEDLKTIQKAKQVDSFIVTFCMENKIIPSLLALKERFPDLNWKTGWFFYTNERDWMRLQYPMRWWNKEAIGTRRISEFTATVYAYAVDYHCKDGP
ncbi:MAG: hypothetical protein HY036_03820 [Nitrospirae bacterium]|nr:hypothetical protein [Nitrospirota bacterium]